MSGEPQPRRTVSATRVCGGPSSRSGHGSSPVSLRASGVAVAPGAPGRYAQESADVPLTAEGLTDVCNAALAIRVYEVAAVDEAAAAAAAEAAAAAAAAPAGKKGKGAKAADPDAGGDGGDGGEEGTLVDELYVRLDALVAGARHPKTGVVALDVPFNRGTLRVELRCDALLGAYALSGRCLTVGAEGAKLLRLPGAWAEGAGAAAEEFSADAMDEAEEAAVAAGVGEGDGDGEGEGGERA